MDNKTKPTPILVSKVQEVATKNGMTEKEFIGTCLQNDICMPDAARRVWGGEVNIRLATLAGIASLFRVQLSDLVEVLPEPGKPGKAGKK